MRLTGDTESRLRATGVGSGSILLLKWTTAQKGAERGEKEQGIMLLKKEAHGHGKEVRHKGQSTEMSR